MSIKLSFSGRHEEPSDEGVPSIHYLVAVAVNKVADDFLVIINSQKMVNEVLEPDVIKYIDVFESHDVHGTTFHEKMNTLIKDAGAILDRIYDEKKYTHLDECIEQVIKEISHWLNQTK